MSKYLAISLAALAMTFFSCNNNKKTGTENPNEEIEVLPENIVELRDDQSKQAGIEFGKAELRTISGTLKVNGTVSVAPQNLATVCVPMGGFVKSAFLMTGNAVRKGQALAVIENQDFIDIQQNYLEARNKFVFAEAEYKRHNELFKQDVYSEKNLQQITSEFKSLKAQVKALEQKLLMIGINPSGLNEDGISRSVTVVSPISGYIKTVNINVGKFVSPSDVLFEIENRDKLFLELTIFEKDADKITEGQIINFFINNETDTHKAVIYQTGKSIGTDKTYKVYAKVSDDCKNIMPGMYVNALIETSGNKVNSLPSDAIVSFDDKFYIFIFEKEKEEDGKPFTEFRMIQVTKGVTGNGYTEVNLPDDLDISKTKIVIKGAYNLLAAKKNAGDMAC